MFSRTAPNFKRENSEQGIESWAGNESHALPLCVLCVWKEANIIHREPYLYKRKIIEASYTKLADQTISCGSQAPMAALVNKVSEAHQGN